MSGSEVVILSESAAQFLLPGKEPLGAAIIRLPGQVRFSGRPRVIGVVEDIKYDGLDAPAGRTIYVPWNRLPVGPAFLIASTSGEGSAMTAAIRRTITDLDASVPVPEVTTLSDVIWRSIAGRRLSLLTALLFGTH